MSEENVAEVEQALVYDRSERLAAKVAAREVPEVETKAVETSSEESNDSENNVDPETTETNADGDLEENESEDSGEESENIAESEPATKKKTGIEKRINKVVKEREEAKQEAAFLRGQLEALTGGQGNQVAPEIQPVADPNMPDPSRYTDPIKYQIDLGIYQALEQQKFTAKIQEAKTKHPDLDELLKKNPTYNPTPEMVQLIKDSEVTSELYYYFASHANEYNEINRMNTLNKAKAIGKIEAKLTEQVSKTETKVAVSKAPKPITPVKAQNVKPMLEKKTKYEIY